MVKRVQNHTTRNWLIGCGGISILGALVVVAGAVVGYFSIPEVSQQMPTGLNPLLVTISQPPNGATLPLDQPASVYVEAFGDQPIQDIQLLADGVPLPAGSSSPAGGQKMIASFSYTPGKPGIHVLVARANTPSGRDGISNALTIKALAQDQIPLPLALNGLAAVSVLSDQAEQVPQDEGTPSGPPTGFNEQGGPSNPPPPPPPDPGSQEPPSEPAQQPGSNLIPIKYSLWAQNLAKNLFGVDLPAAPKLDGGAKLCEGILVVQDNSTDELGFFLYRLGPGKLAFERVATLDGKSGKSTFSYHDPGLTQGSYSYYLASFNAAGETPGNIITFQITDAKCALPGPETIVFDSLKMKTKTPVDQVYCYVSANGNPWTRIPSGQNSFIQATNGEFDLNPYLGSLPLPKPPQTETIVNIECWGWNGATLTYLGSGKQSWKPEMQFMIASQLFEITGDGGKKIPPPGPYPDPNGPYTDLLAAPYNAYITMDAVNECPQHAPKGGEYQCNTWFNMWKWSLVWTYNRYGPCNPGPQVCDKKYQPADGFHIYRIRNGETELDILSPQPSKATWLPIFEGTEKDEYFVRAYSNTLGESAESNHIQFPKQIWEATINPTSITTNRFSTQNYGNVAPHWDTVTGGMYPGEMMSGYVFSCLNNCSQGQFGDAWYGGEAVFNLPQNMDIQNAWLNWKTSGYIADGPGKNDVVMACGVKLSTDYDGAWLNNMSISGIENFDVSKPVVLTQWDGHNSIKFKFWNPSKKAGAIRWDRCLWTIKDLSLTLHYVNK
jgi:hypothetical protein